MSRPPGKAMELSGTQMPSPRGQRQRRSAEKEAMIVYGEMFARGSLSGRWAHEGHPLASANSEA